MLIVFQIALIAVIILTALASAGMQGAVGVRSAIISVASIVTCAATFFLL